METTHKYGESLGRILRRREVPSFLMKETVYPGNVSVPQHIHGHMSICFVLEGYCLETRDRKTYQYTPMSMALNLPDGWHGFRVHDRGLRCFSIDLAPTWIERFGESSVKLTPRVVLEPEPLVWLAAGIYREYQEMDDLSPLAIESAILEMLVETARSSRPRGPRQPPDWLKQVMDRMRVEFNRPLTLSSIAETAGVHPAHLARVFRAVHRCSPGEFIRRIRIEYASRQLVHTDQTLADIALAAGFYDQSHFSRVFKQATGITPAQFRTMMRPRSSPREHIS